METLGRSRLAALLVGVLVLVVSVSVAFASQGDLLESDPGGPKPVGFDAADAPLAGGAGFAQLQDAFEEQQERDAEREAELASPAFEVAREESQTAFVGVSDGAAESLVEDVFERELDGALRVPDLDEVADGREVRRFVDDRTVIFEGEGDKPAVLVELPSPARAVDDDGHKRPVDLSLEPAGGDLVPENAPVDVAVPDQLAEGVEVGDVTLTPAGSADGEVSGEDGDRVVYANAQLDTDVVVAPVTQGVEVFWQLRSPRAPEELSLDVDLPDGASLQQGEAGSLAVVRGADVLATVTAPVALDAQGQKVAVEMAPAANGIVLSVAHHDEDLAYPILVDPVWEDWYDDGWSTWFDQDPAAIAGLSHWFYTYSGVPANTYAMRTTCYVPVSCYRYGPGHNDNAPDGLHIYVRSGTNYPAGSASQWLYQPPGTTTRIARADFGIKYLRMRSGLTATPVMFNGIWRVGGPWVSSSSFNSDFSNHWNAHFAGSQPGPQQAVFGFFAPTGVTTGSTWRDGYMGSAIIELTDPEAPTTTATNVSLRAGSDPTKWISSDDVFIRPSASDPGLGMYWFEIDGPGTAVDDAREHPTCDGTKSAPCPSSWALGSSNGFELSTDDLPEGVNSVDLYAEDVIENRSGTGIPVKVDRGQPTVTPSGALWNQREVYPVPSGGHPVLSAGSHALSVNATDPAQGAAPAGTRSGVEKVEVRVDGDTVATSQGACAAGNCSRSLNWTLNTADYAGRTTVEVVATDGAGNEKIETFAVNAPARGQLLLPVDGESTSSMVALQAQANEDGFTGVQFQYRRMPFGAWTAIDGTGGTLTDDRGTPVTGTTRPIDQPGRKTAKYIFDARTVLNGLFVHDGPFQIRAVFTGNGTFKSQPSNLELDEKGLSAGNAQQGIGPGTVDLLTGNFNYGATDAAAGSVALTRSFNSLDQGASGTGPFGPGWVTSAPVGGISEFSSITEVKEGTYVRWVDIYDSSRGRVRFEHLRNDGAYKPETGAEALKVDLVAGKYIVTDLDGTVTTFSQPVGAPATAAFVPSKVQEAGASTPTSYAYELFLGEPRLKRIIAPGPPGLDCTGTSLPRGCKVLELTYSQLSVGSRLTSVAYKAWNPDWGGFMGSETVAQFTYWGNGDGIGRLAEAWDPRISPALKETYQYDSRGRLTTITPAGEAPWSIAYMPTTDVNVNKLSSISRTATSSGTATWRMAWDIPLSGSGAPYPMAATNLDAWGQTDRPTDATAIYPPTETGTNLAKATVSYLNQDGRTVNTANPGGGIETAEYDPKGNVIRTLTPANREKALAVGGGSATLAGLLSTYSTYSADGLELKEELGPQHEVKLDSGQIVDARAHTVTNYDQDSTLPTLQAAHLPTTETTSARVGSTDEDVRVNKTEYDWSLRKPTKTIVDATSGGLNIARQTSYNSAGLETESRMPKSNGSDAGTTKTVYYTHDASSPEAACRNRPEWWNLPCKTMPAAQPGTAGLPDLAVTTYTYDRFGGVATAGEQVGSDIRTATTTIDASGRTTKTEIDSTAGTAVEDVTTSYSTTTGRPTTVSTPSGTLTTSYDNIGRVTGYTDAHGTTSTTTYDNMDRPTSASDGKGTRYFGYHGTTGRLTTMTDFDIGAFTASYDKDGRIVSKTYPNGMTAETTYDEAGSPVRLVYTKTTNCSSNCTWIDEQVTESIHGQWRTHDWELSSQTYTYDQAGRLTEVEDDVHSPTAVKGCTIRSYAFDDNSNRSSLTTRAPASNGDCQPAATGTQRTYSYDDADRVTGTGMSYDPFGRTTAIPAQHAGGGALSYTYYANDQVRTIAQDGISKTYTLDPAGRQRQTVAAGGTTHTEQLHYQDNSDSPAWTAIVDGQGQEVSWERNVEGIDGDLAAIRTHDSSGDETVLQLTNLHGDVVATASSNNPNALDAKFETDEYGNPRQPAGANQRYGWLGGKQRRTELDSGVIQMGVRSYIPSLGRFTSVDPVVGGSANAYDYGNADPVNQLDLSGLYPGEGTKGSEKRFCYRPWNASRCKTAREISDRAKAATARIYKRRATVQDGRADAYRHCYWNALMTFKLGSSFAEEIGSRHEDFDGNEDAKMDLHNNFMGRRIAMNREDKRRGTRARLASKACVLNARPGGELMVTNR